MPSAWMICFIRRIWSSVSRMVKSLLSPAISAWRRSILAPIEWKVPSHCMPSTTPPMRSPTRVFISRAALLVKVTARICQGLARPVPSRWAMRVVSTRVLPVPAPASTSTGPSVASTASRCSGFSLSSHGVPRAPMARAAMPPGCGEGVPCAAGGEAGWVGSSAPDGPLSMRLAGSVIGPGDYHESERRTL